MSRYSITGSRVAARRSMRVPLVENFDGPTFWLTGVFDELEEVAADSSVHRPRR